MVESPYEDSAIGDKLHHLRRTKKVSQREVAEFLSLACGRQRSTRWVSSVEAGNGVIYEDEVKALEAHWDMDFSSVQVPGFEALREESAGRSGIFVSEGRDFFRLQQHYLQQDPEVEFEMWFTNPGNLRFLRDPDARSVVTENLANGVDYCLLWSMDSTELSVFEEFLFAAKRISGQLEERGIEPGSRGKIRNYPVSGLSPFSEAGNSSGQVLHRQYGATMRKLSEAYPLCEFNETRNVSKYEQPESLMRLLWTEWAEDISLCVFLPRENYRLFKPEIRPIVLLQFETVAVLEDLDVAHEEQGWLMMGKKFTDQRAKILWDFNRWLREFGD